MNFEKLEKYAKDMLIEVGLTDWTFAWNNRVRSSGLCSYRKKTIFLSKKLSPLRTEAQNIETIAHEVAHALHPREAHSEAWRDTCIRLGGTGERCAEGAAPPYTWVMEYKGELVKGYYRKPTVAIRKLPTTFLVGREKETLGKLTIRKV